MWIFRKFFLQTVLLLSEAEENTSGLLNKGDVVDLRLFRILAIL